MTLKAKRKKQNWTNGTTSFVRFSCNKEQTETKPTELDKIIAKYISDKGLIIRMHKEK